MFRKVILSPFIAMALLVVLAATAAAQGTPTNFSVVAIEPAVATVVQSVPVTLTVHMLGPTGMMTVEVPVILHLTVQVGLSSGVTTTVVATAAVAASAPSPVVVTPTAQATATPTRVAPTATPRPAPTATATPAGAITATAVLTPTGTPTQTVQAEANCPDPRAQITSPIANQVVSGTVAVVGSANHDKFQYYKLEYAKGANVDSTGDFAYIADARSPVANGLLAQFDSKNFVNGPYTLRLMVVDNTGNFPPPCRVTINVKN